METYKVLEGFLNQSTLHSTHGGELPCIVSPRKDKFGEHKAFLDKAFGKLEPGDPFGIPEKGIGMWANTHLTQPRPRDFHFGILWMRHPYRADWLTLESSPAGHGVRPGLLSYHLPGPIDIYRVAADEKIRHGAPWALSDWCTQSKKEQAYTTYGFIDFPGLFASGILSWAEILATEHRFRALTAAELSRFYKLNRSIICTAAVWLSYKLCGFDFEGEIHNHEWRLKEISSRIFGHPITTPPPQPKAAPLPCVFERALELGILEVIYHA